VAITRQPAFTNRRTDAAPKPDVAPVIIAVLAMMYFFLRVDPVLHLQCLCKFTTGSG